MRINSKVKKYIVVIILFLITFSLLLPFLIIGFQYATKDWSPFPNQLIQWDVQINLNNQYEFDVVQLIFPNFEQSQIVSWRTNYWNPFSAIGSEWINVYGSTSWNERAAAWLIAGTVSYNLSGNTDSTIPVDLNINNLLVIPLRGTENITLEKLRNSVGGTIQFNHITYSVEDVIFAYKLSTTLFNPSPNVNTISEIMYINKIDGTLIDSSTTIKGTGVHGWEYTKTIHVGQNFLYLLITLITCFTGGAIVFIYYRRNKRRRFIKIDDEI